MKTTFEIFGDSVDSLKLKTFIKKLLKQLSLDIMQKRGFRGNRNAAGN